MSYNANRRALIRQPCTRDCPDRSAGCAASCPKWAEYVKSRNQDYEHRKQVKQVSDAVCDGFDRIKRISRKR